MRLHRTVRRTIAAIFMIMAVVVAAIPVEQLGTMQAAARTTKIDDIYNTVYNAQGTTDAVNNIITIAVDDANKYDRKKDSEIYSVTMTPTSEGAVYEKEFRIVKRNGNSNSYVILEYAGNAKTADIDLTKKRYTEYFVITKDYVAEVENILKSEIYTVTFNKTSQNTTISDSEGKTYTIPAEIVYSEGVIFSGARTEGSILQNKYKYTKGKDIDDSIMVSTYAGVAYSARKSAIDSYNLARTNLINDSKNMSSAAVEAEIKNSGLTNDNFENLLKLTIKYKPDDNDPAAAFDKPEDFLKYNIIKRFYADSSSFSLDGFNLLKLVSDNVSDSANSGVYVPQWTSVFLDVKDDSRFAYVREDDGFISFQNPITISGIGNDAFNKGDQASSGPNTDQVSVSIGKLILSDQVNFIGQYAFNNQNLLSDVELSYCKVIGNDAFYDCTKLSEVTFGDENSVQSTQVLGARAFYNCKMLSQITFPRALKNIGTACFAKSGLASFKMSKVNTAGSQGKSTLTIWPFAFYDCSNLEGSDTANTADYFNSNVDITLGMGCFAVSGNNKMTTFTFPTNMTKFFDKNNDRDPFGIKDALPSGIPKSGNTPSEVYYDYILAGRTSLDKVIFPGTLSYCKIPDNTLLGCANLSCVVFGEAAYREDTNHCQQVTFDSPNIGSEVYDSDGDGEYLFQDIANENFYVIGPGFNSTGSGLASLREQTKAAQTAVSDSVPYIYLNERDEEQIEASYGDYVATVVVNGDGDKTVTLENYKFIDDSKEGNIRNLIVPATIAGYQVTQLGTGCFDKVKGSIIELTIKDGYLQNINDGALQGATKLARVNIGNSVTTIGEGAFADCPKLENVYFADPVSTGTEMSIADGAFETNSKYLTFHGKIAEDYTPYVYAMSSANAHFTNQAANRNICYQVDSPTNIKVIRDNVTGKSTLVDYPHFEEIDIMNQDVIDDLQGDQSSYSIIDKFKEKQGWTNTTKYSDDLTDEENAIILNTLMVSIPDGVQSLDSRAYFLDGKNESNKDYLTLKCKETDDNIEKSSTSLIRKLNPGTSTSDPVKLYSEDNYVSLRKGHAGLFSGYFNETTNGFKDKEFDYSLNENLNGQTYTEDVEQGNDLLTGIGLGTVESLPDYAFYSCENLLSVRLESNYLKEMGKIPFSGCKKLTGIESDRNVSLFFSENAIIYQREADDNARTAGDLTIIECLESRGDADSPDIYKRAAIDTENDKMLPQVTAIAEEAFAYNQDITSVDLSDTQITEIPKGCFKDASSLRSVILPSTVTYIDDEAFYGTSPDVYIANPTCAIGKAFDDAYIGNIYSYKYIDDTNTEESPIFKYFKNTRANFKEIGYIVTFMVDGSIYGDAQNVAENGAANLPEDPKKTGYTFKYWQWTDSNGDVHTGTDAYTYVKENRKLIAVFELNGIVSDGSKYTITVTGGTADGSTSASKTGGSPVGLQATGVSTTQSFQYWSASGKDDNVDYTSLITDVHSATTSMLMPNANVTVTAHYTTNSSDSNSGNNNSGNNSNNNNSGNNSGNNSSDSTTKYKLTVNYGSGSGEYTAGQVVTISAFAPESSSKVFSKWTSTTAGVGFANASAASTTITMPATEATVTANYKTRTSDDGEDDSDAANRRRGTTTTTTTVANGTNNAQNTTTTTTTTNGTTTSTTTQGDRLSIDKTGISNKDVGSTTVEGATDNFIVKVSDSDSAVAEAQAALMNKFGSLDGIVYMPMDISLYDITGKNKIQDTTGLNVNITIPIPDEMIQYGGNVHMAAIENSQLQDLNVKFTTIDGIACMSFTAPHFSPYVAYVDTQNLVAGQMLDATPKTGDPIHPKWFLAAGMACLSIILFASGDKKRKIKIA